MTEQLHPMIPPPELITKWMTEARSQDYCSITEQFAYHAAQWGADQELEACLCEISFLNSSALADRVRKGRRPKPPSLKQQALQELDKVDMLWETEEFGKDTLNSLDTIRKALEALPGD